MKLSIVILSYNRPKQIERILKYLTKASSGDYNVIIKDDCSPKFDEIESVYNKYKPLLDFELILSKNKSNLGYDGNLIGAFDVSGSEYVFLLSDDDYIDGSKIDSVISSLECDNKDFYYAPYTDNTTGIIHRNIINGDLDNVEVVDFGRVIYNAILFSGLVYKRSSVLGLNLDREFLSTCIYTQVYLAVLLVFKSKSYGVIPSDVLYLGGDGDNFFGKNESAINTHLLEDRTKLTSNLNYQPFLLETIKRASLSTDGRIYPTFLKEFRVRTVSYGLRVRSFGLRAYCDFFVAYIKSNLPSFVPLICLFVCFFAVPRRFASLINRFGLKVAKKSG